MRLSDYSAITIQESGDPMVDLAQYPFVLEPVQFRKRYTKNPQLWLRKTAATRMEDVQRSRLDDMGLRFKVFDAWRPRDVQHKVYAACWNDLAQKHPDLDHAAIDRMAEQYVLDSNDPNHIPPHVTGGAVDVTLVQDATGQELDMGVPYLSWQMIHPDQQPKEVSDNMRILIIAMQEAGFVQDPDQWWHFDYGNQKWAKIIGNDLAIYGEVNPSMGFMAKGTGFGHGVLLPYELR